VAPGKAVRVAALALLSLPAAAGCASVADGPEVHALPVIERERPVPSAPWTTDWLWPFGHDEDRPPSTSTGFRPLWRRVRTGETERHEVLYPLWRDAAEGEEYHARLFPLYARDRVPSAGGLDTDTVVLPFLWWGDEPGQGPYFLLFPLGGTVKQKLLVDEGTFVLFPAYLRTRNGAYRGTHLLWPLVHFGSGGGRAATRVLPLFSFSDKEGVYRRRSVLWPFVHWSAEDIDTPHPRSGWMAWPFFGRDSSDVSGATTLLWPFFQWSDAPRAWARDLPFPFYRRRVTADEAGATESELLWLWPFHGRFDGPGDRSRFYAWPLVFTTDVEEAGRRRRGLIVAPFWSRQSAVPLEGGGAGDSWWKAWPLAEGESRADGGSGWSSLSIIPIVRWPEFDANWGVFFELVRRRRDPDGSSSTDLLFSLIRSRRGPGSARVRVPGIFRAESAPGRRSWALLGGLLGGESTLEDGSSLRLLWFLKIPASRGKR